MRSKNDDRQHAALRDAEDDNCRGSRPKLTLGLLVGFCVGFFLAAATVVLLRSLENETDGITAFTYAMAILGPALILTIFVWFLQRKQVSRKLHKLAAAAMLMAGLGFGGAIWNAAPTQWQIREAELQKIRPLAAKRANQLASFRTQVESLSTESLEVGVSEQHLAALGTADMDFTDDGNAILCTIEDLARVKADTDPESIMLSYERPRSEFPMKDRYEYSTDSKADDIAMVGFGDPFMLRYELRQFDKLLHQLRYVCIVRMTVSKDPIMLKNEFVPGYRQGQAFCFDLEEDSMTAAFTFSSTNSKSVDYRYKDGSEESEKKGTIKNYLKSDLDDNVWPGFWHQLHRLASNAKSDHSDTELSYDDEWLSLGRSMWERKMDKAQIDQILNPKQDGQAQQAAEVAPTQPQATSTNVELNPQQQKEVQELFASQGKLPAVKRVRELSGAGLKDCLSYVETLIAK